jgi:hypothetical protein
MAVLEKRPSKTLGFLRVFSSENDFFNTLLSARFWTRDCQFMVQFGARLFAPAEIN